jgi:ribosome recycling factor
MLPQIHKETEDHMKKAVESTKTHFAQIRTGRASVSLLDSVRVDYYGTPTPLNQVCNLATPDAHLIVATPWEHAMVKEIETAVRNANLGLNPVVDGKLIRIPVPTLTEERRKELAKKAHTQTEEGKVSIRNIRRDANDKVKKLLKDRKISEDEDKKAHEQIQKLHDKYIAELDGALKTKEKEILSI